MASGVTFGYSLPHFGQSSSPDQLTNLTRDINQAGFGSIWLRDHIVLPGGQPFFDPVVTHAVISNVAGDMDLGTATLIPVRHPVVLTKSLTTLATFTECDLIVGLGKGALKLDFDAVDVPFEKRDRALVETIDILKGLCDTEEFSYDGELYSFENVTVAPRPPEPFPKIWLGGSSKSTLLLASSDGDGWIPYAIPVDRFERGVNLFQRESDSEKEVAVILPTSISTDGSVPRSTQESIIDRLGEEGIEKRALTGTPEECLRRIVQYVDAGADHIIFDSRYDIENIDRHIELIRDNVLTEF